ncbi:MAG: YidC/Oxa1 family membrane protein insertase [Planctomycetes bacterium]|nr:YidC/Oxa1 family membrane protein insertase [Planctomycetota bacterium]
MMNKQMVYFMPAITFFIGLSLPGGLVLYWFVVTLLTALQQLVMFGKNKSKPGQPEVVGTGSSNQAPPDTTA